MVRSLLIWLLPVVPVALNYLFVVPNNHRYIGYFFSIGIAVGIVLFNHFSPRSVEERIEGVIVELFCRVSGISWCDDAATVAPAPVPGRPPPGPSVPATPRLTSPPVAAPSFGTPACPGASVPARLTLGAAWVPVNAGACRLVFVIAEGEVVFDTDQGEKRYDASDLWAARFRIGSVRSVRAGRERAVLDYSLCPMDGAAEVNWDCSPKQP